MLTLKQIREDKAFTLERLAVKRDAIQRPSRRSKRWTMNVNLFRLN